MPQSSTSTAVRPNGSARFQPSNGNTVGTTARLAARNRTRVLVGCLVLIVSALAAAVLYSNASNRQMVLAINRPIAVGQVVQNSDLRDVSVAVGPGVTTVPATERSHIVGRTAAVALVPGALLTPNQLGDGSPIDASLAIVGAQLKPGQYPSGLRAGDHVLAFVIPPDAAIGESTTPKAIDATVVRVDQGGDAATSIVVSLGVAPGDAGVVTTAAARNRLNIVLAPR